MKALWLENDDSPDVADLAASHGSENEVIRDGLRALLARDRAVKNWLLTQVGPAYDALKADPSRAVSVDQVRERIASEHASQCPATLGHVAISDIY